MCAGVTFFYLLPFTLRSLAPWSFSERGQADREAMGGVTGGPERRRAREEQASDGNKRRCEGAAPDGVGTTVSGAPAHSGGWRTWAWQTVGNAVNAASGAMWNAASGMWGRKRQRESEGDEDAERGKRQKDATGDG